VSETLERGAEITKLARLLGVEPTELGYLAGIPAAALRDFRELATDRMFAGDAGRLHRVAAASRLVPVPLTVKIAQLAFGPVLCAATAGLLDPRHAVRVASSCPTDFLADITVHLDPRRAPEVIAAVPTPLVVAVAKELLARGEHVTMGRFVSYLSPETLRAAVAEIPDDADLLRVAFVMEGKHKLDELIDVARDRIGGLIRTAYEQRLWAEALDLIGHLSVANLAEIAEVATAEDEQLLEALVEAAHELDAWDVLLPTTAAMSPDSLRRFAALATVRRQDVLAAIVDAALVGPHWLHLLPLTRQLPDDVRAEVAAHVAARHDDDLERLAVEAHDAQMWDALLPIALALADDARRRLVRLPVMQRADVVRAAVETADRHELWDAALPLIDALLSEGAPDAVWDVLVDVRPRLPDAVRAALRARAQDLGRPDVASAIAG
jgi:hypothetical protein